MKSIAYHFIIAAYAKKSARDSFDVIAPCGSLILGVGGVWEKTRRGWC